MLPKVVLRLGVASLSMRQMLGLAPQEDRPDHTSGSLDRAMRVLAIPMVLEMLAESIFAVVDVFWVARLGAASVAVVGLVEAAMTLIYAFSIGIAFAASALVARRVGETKDPAAAAPIAGQVIILVTLLSLVLGLPMAWFACDILRLLGADAATAALGENCARIMFAGNLTLSLMFVCSAALRGTGEAQAPMRALWLANVCNMVFAPCLILGWGTSPALGVTGAAIATTLSRGIGVLYQARYLARREGYIGLRWAHLVPVLAQLRRIGRIAWSGVAQMLIASTSAIGLFAIAARSGNVALAGCTIALRVSQFVLLPSLGVARAGAVLVGQNLGAGHLDRAIRAVRIAVRINAIALAGVGVILFVTATPIAGLFSNDRAILDEAIRALRIVSIAFPFYAAGMCFQSAFNGAGDTWTPAWVNFICFWLLQIPLAWVLAVPCGLGTFGLYLAVPLGFFILAVVSGTMFARGRWKAHLI